MNNVPATSVDTTACRLRGPLVFGGIPEAEGWALAPITPRDRVHFRTDRELPLEELRRGVPTACVPSENGKPEGFGVEIADAIIRCLDLTEALGIDIGERILEKHEYNGTRPHRHGGKKL